MRIAEFVVFYIALGGTKMISSGYTISKPGKCSDIKCSYSYIYERAQAFGRGPAKSSE